MLAPRYQTLRTFPRAAGKPRGFTLAELLITIGIIGLLIGLLIPTVTAVRRSAQDADTRQFIAAITAACEAYYQDFQSYPGPLSNDQIYARANPEMLPAIPPGSTATEAQMQIVRPDNSVSQFTLRSQVTGAENLFAGLMGGIKIVQVTNTVPLAIESWGFDGQSIGKGPGGLNPRGKIQATQAYMAVKSSDYTDVLPIKDQSDPSFNTQLAAVVAPNPEQSASANFPSITNPQHWLDSSLPEFLDRYTDKMPILYLRARKGAPGIMSDNFTNAPTSSLPTQSPDDAGTDKFQYDRNDIAAYVDSNIGAPGSIGHGLRSLENSYSNLIFNGPLVKAPPLPAGQNKKNYRIPYLNYFKSPTSSTDQSISDFTQNNRRSSPRQKDSYILISAGRDRIYGTIDDITNFGPLE
jgi:prepilin-type N-terminal cleavage/methylation domain-containing protein